MGTPCRAAAVRILPLLTYGPLLMMPGCHPGGSVTSRTPATATAAGTSQRRDDPSEPAGGTARNARPATRVTTAAPSDVARAPIVGTRTNPATRAPRIDPPVLAAYASPTERPTVEKRGVRSRATSGNAPPMKNVGRTNRANTQTASASSTFACSPPVAA